MNNPTYEKFLSRDFALATIECWGQGETVDPRQWTDNQQPFLPYEVMVRNKDIVDAYVDNRGVDWIKEEILRLYQEKENFTDLVIDECVKRLEPVAEALKSEKPVPQKDFEAFAAKLRDIWPWFEALWWFIEMLDEKNIGNEDLKKLQVIRRKYDYLAPSADATLRNSLKDYYPELGKFTDVLLIDEAVSRKIPEKGELEKRLNYFVYINGAFVTDKSMTEVEEEYGFTFEKKEIDKTAKTLKGNIAYKGKVRGKVRKVFRRSDVQYFEEGEILVSPTTTPDFVDAMKRAAAFVTNEGGIISHAAILSRELKKPCIIGVKHATDILQDGDEVEVDAESGIVTILKRKS